MYSSPQLSFIGIIFLHLIHFTIAQTTSSCQSIYVRIESTSNSLDTNNWDGVYSIVHNKKSFNGSIWIISNSNKWLKYIETHWVLSGLNNELLIYESNILFPPINESSIWIHEFYNDPIQIRLDCSSTLSPTASPTPSPTALPTYSPTISNCNILIVSDSSDSNNKMNTTYFLNWKYYLLSTKDFYNRPIWKYINDNTISYIEYLNANGWIVRLNNGHSITIYASNNNKLFGNFPLLNTEILFNITTNNGLLRIFKFICISSDIPTNSPSLTPSISPTNQPITIPIILPTSNPILLPTFLPTNQPTISPSIDCEILKINIERNLIINNNPNCNINFEIVFNSYWLKQISKTNRPSWTLDCNDNNNEYIVACTAGYSGSVFFISNQWEIQIHSKKDDCFSRFIIDNTNSYFIPINKQWTDVSTFNKYIFNIQCTDRMYIPTPQLTGDTFITKNKIYIYNQIWFWIAFLLILLICAILCIAAYYWNKQRKQIIINYKQKQIKSQSHMNVSKQELELQNTPKQAYIDHDIAPAHTQPINNINDNQLQYKSNMVTDGDPHVTGGTINPNIKNPNLKNNNSNNKSQRNIGEELKENISISDNDNIEELYNENNKKEKETPVNTDQALNMIAGDKQATGYNGNPDDVITQDEYIDEIFSV